MVAVDGYGKKLCGEFEHLSLTISLHNETLYVEMFLKSQVEVPNVVVLKAFKYNVLTL